MEGTCIYYVLARKWQGSTMVGGPAIKYFRIWSVYIGLRCTFQSGLRSFCKPWSKKIVLNIWTLIPTQRYKQLSGYDTEYRSSSPRVFFTIVALENLEIWDAINFSVNLFMFCTQSSFYRWQSHFVNDKTRTEYKTYHRIQIRRRRFIFLNMSTLPWPY